MKTLRISGFMWILMGIAAALFFSGCREAKFVKRTSADPDKQVRLDWSYQTSVEVYQKSSFKGYRWNQFAVNALAEFACVRSGVFASNEPCAAIISSNAAAAIRSGCKDPLVNYLFIKYAMSPTNSKEAFTDAFYKTTLAMEGSSYPPIRKFYAGFRAIQQYGWANKWPTNWPAEMQDLYHRTIDQLSAVISDSNTPATEVYDACHEFLNNEGRNKQDYPKYWETMEPLVFNHWSEAYQVWLLKGEANVRLAWLARGDGTADTVSEAGWKQFSEHLNIAEKSLERAWEIYPHDVRIPIEMMSVMLGQGGGRERMETWFNRAMEVDPNSNEACQKKLYYLEPKWHGTTEEQIAFGRECLHSTKWGGQVPLALLDAHNYINDRNPPPAQTNYWRQAEVWTDVQAAFERFFEINPDAASWYHNYAWYAYHAQHWKKLNELLPKLGPVNYEYFGGKDEYDRMVQLAEEHNGGK